MLDNNFQIIYLILFIIGSIIRSFYTKSYRKKKPKFNLDFLLIAIVSLGFIALPFVWLFSTWLDFANYNLPNWLSWLGIPIFILAIWLLAKSHIDLDKNFSPIVEIQEKHTLITNGIYNYIRHPMYAAHFLWGLAQFLLLTNWIAGPAMLVLFYPFYFYRVAREEKKMVEHFGKEYVDYMKRTGRMVPKL